MEKDIICFYYQKKILSASIKDKVEIDNVVFMI